MYWLTIAIGGALGAISRYGLIQLLSPVGNGFPWAIWTANIIGSASVGLCYVVIVEKGIIAEQWRPFMMIGFLGALTTFSTFALDSLLLWQNGQLGTAVIYIVSSVIGCLLCAAGAIWLAQQIF